MMLALLQLFQSAVVSIAQARSVVPCYHGIDLGNGCICLDEWTGANCTVLPCQNGGSFDAKTEKCICAGQYMGSLCQEKCQHGTIIADGSCTCQPNFSGVSCDKAKCLYGSWNEATGLCDCYNGFVGELCNRCLFEHQLLMPRCERVVFESAPVKLLRSTSSVHMVTSSTPNDIAIALVALLAILLPCCLTTFICFITMRKAAPFGSTNYFPANTRTPKLSRCQSDLGINTSSRQDKNIKVEYGGTQSQFFENQAFEDKTWDI